MSHLTPIRDDAGGIVGLQPKGEKSQFAATLADTVQALGPEPTPPVAAPVESRGLAMIVGGLVAALALVAALNVFQTPTGRPAPVAPTAAPAPPTARRTPTAAPVPTSTPTALPEPPTQTPIVIVQQAPPIQCWTVTLDVTDAHGTPIGIATGESCDSQEAARANAEAHAEQVKATHERR
jgi:hypothetical protein